MLLMRQTVLACVLLLTPLRNQPQLASKLEGTSGPLALH